MSSDDDKDIPNPFGKKNKSIEDNCQCLYLSYTFHIKNFATKKVLKHYIKYNVKHLKKFQKYYQRIYGAFDE